MPTSVQVSPSQAKDKLNKIYGSFSYIWSKQLALNEINARKCRERLEEILVSGKTGSIDGEPGDVYNLLT